MSSKRFCNAANQLCPAEAFDNLTDKACEKHKKKAKELRRRRTNVSIELVKNFVFYVLDTIVTTEASPDEVIRRVICKANDVFPMIHLLETKLEKTKMMQCEGDLFDVSQDLS